METQQDVLWRVVFYGSGTHVVTTNRPEEPWFYVYGPLAQEGFDDVRYKMCEDLSAFMNGSSRRPLWLDDMTRVSETLLEGFDGSSVFATGPMYDTDPPKLCWAEKQDQEAKDKRARLIDKLFLRSNR